MNDVLKLLIIGGLLYALAKQAGTASALMPSGSNEIRPLFTSDAAGTTASSRTAGGGVSVPDRSANPDGRSAWARGGDYEAGRLGPVTHGGGAWSANREVWM